MGRWGVARGHIAKKSGAPGSAAPHRLLLCHKVGPEFRFSLPFDSEPLGQGGLPTARPSWGWFGGYVSSAPFTHEGATLPLCPSRLGLSGDG